ncbi:MAG: cytochrome c biogenesis protein CcsA [Pseudomonadota bacterium]
MGTVLIGVVGFVAYAIATIQLYTGFASGREIAVRRNLLITVLALGCHAWVVSAAYLTPEGLNRGLFVSLSFMGLLINVLVVAGSLISPLRSLGLIAFPVGAAFLGTQLIAGQTPGLVTNFDWQMETHIAIALFSFAILSLAAAQAVLLAMQERLLRSPQFSARLAFLPPLTTMEQLLFQMIGLGFVLLTMTLITGVVFVDDLFGQALVHKTVLSFAGWIVFGALLWGRWRHGWRGRRAVRLTLAGVAVLGLAYFGSKFVLEVLLDRV